MIKLRLGCLQRLRGRAGRLSVLEVIHYEDSVVGVADGYLI
jgi:hypothetical protein